MALVYAAKLGIKNQLTNIGAQKIDGIIFKMFRIVLATFQIKDKLNKTCFFQKKNLLTTTNIDVILKMSFLIFNNANIIFID